MQKKKRICKDIIKADGKDFLFDFDFRELGLHALTTSYFYPLCCFFSDGAMLRSYGEIMLRLFVTGFFFFFLFFFFSLSFPLSLSLSSVNLRGSRGFRSGTKACDCTTFSMTQLLWCQL